MSKITKSKFYEELCSMFPQLTRLTKGVNTTVDINDACALYTVETSAYSIAGLASAFLHRIECLIGLKSKHEFDVHFVDTAHDVEYIIALNMDSKSADVRHKFCTNFEQYCFPWIEIAEERSPSLLTNRTECLAYIRNHTSLPSLAPTI